jgi:ribulose 1,5-bisphosphate carboxylase large subunit-like protein|tara:strand:- start:1595 stop:1753 length:159 start_codon:yes stop_codon:yes gene_type:complete
MKINRILKIIDINLRNFFRKKLKGKKTFVKIICKILNLDENNILSVTNEGGQ